MWYFGDESFRDKLLALTELKGLKGRKKKSDLRKVAIATLLKTKTKTEVTNRWIGTRLEMGHENSISRHIRKGRTDAKTKNLVLKLEKMLRAWTDPLVLAAIFESVCKWLDDSSSESNKGGLRYEFRHEIWVVRLVRLSD